MYKTLWNYVSKHSKKATIVLCSGGYAGLIFGFLGGIFYIYKDAASLPHTATGLYNHQNTHLA